MLKKPPIDCDFLFDAKFMQSIADAKPSNRFFISGNCIERHWEDGRSTRIDPQLINIIAFWDRVCYGQLFLSLIF